MMFCVNQFAEFCPSAEETIYTSDTRGVGPDAHIKKENPAQAGPKSHAQRWLTAYSSSAKMKSSRSGISCFMQSPPFLPSICEIQGRIQENSSEVFVNELLTRQSSLPRFRLSINHLLEDAQAAAVRGPRRVFPPAGGKIKFNQQKPRTCALVFALRLGKCAPLACAQPNANSPRFKPA